MTELKGSILSESGWIAGKVRFGTHIEDITGDPLAGPVPPYIVPGFVDLHVHGGGGVDMMTGAEAIRRAAALHLRHGTTALLATSVTAPPEEIESFLDAVADCAEELGAQRALVVGAHLEGPFINPERLGAQPPFAREADVSLMTAWLGRAPIKVVTYAPERDPDDRLRDLLLQADVRAQLGHALCHYARAKACLEAGCGATHLFNAMSGVAHRGNGIAGAVLAHGDHAEIIPDLVHVEPGAILAARRAIPNLYGVTDATAGAGAPDGDYPLGRLTARKAEGAMRLPDGTLAGSALTMDVALRNLVSIGLPVAEAVRRLSTIPANWIRRKDIGRIAIGARADLLTLDAELRLTEVRLGGKPNTAGPEEV